MIKIKLSPELISHVKVGIGLLLLSLMLASIFVWVNQSRQTSLSVNNQHQKLLKIRDHSVRSFQINQQRFEFEVVNTQDSIIQGLSGRDELPADGMLFVFLKLDKPGFWMKEMKFPLDFIWVDDQTVIEVTQNVQPSPTGFDESNLTLYQPKDLVNLVLEVEHGFVEKYQVKEGDKLYLVD